jgi:hypothetical protein
MIRREKLEKLTVSVDRDLRDAAHRKSEETGRSISHVVREALRRWVDGSKEAEGAG